MSRQQRQERVQIRPRFIPVPRSKDFFFHTKKDPAEQPQTCGACLYFSRKPGTPAGDCDHSYQQMQVKGDTPACPNGEKKRPKSKVR